MDVSYFYIFKYLGVIATDSNDIEVERARMFSGTRYVCPAVISLIQNHIWKAKLMIYKTIIRPMVMYGHET